MTVRKFIDDDAEFCFRVRCAAFVEKFYDEIGPRIVSLCVNAHMPRDFVEFSKHMTVFIVEYSGHRIGFFSIKRIGRDAAEIPFIYFELERISSGYGRKAMSYLEKWVKANWVEVKRIYLDTIIPGYNSGFYRKMGYEEIGESSCVYSGCEVKARRFQKRLS